MARSIRHSFNFSGPNQRGELIEVRVRQGPTPADVVRQAEAAVCQPRLGALAYTVEVDDAGEEVGYPVVLGRWGTTPPEAP